MGSTGRPITTRSMSKKGVKESVSEITPARLTPQPYIPIKPGRGVDRQLFVLDKDKDMQIFRFLFSINSFPQLFDITSDTS